jgi:hypothetical protein
MKAAFIAVLIATTLVFWAGYYRGKKVADKWWYGYTHLLVCSGPNISYCEYAPDGSVPVHGFVNGNPYYWHGYAFVCSVDRLVVGNIYPSSNGWTTITGFGTLKPEFDTKEAAMAYVERKTKFICEQGGIK